MKNRNRRAVLLIAAFFQCHEVSHAARAAADTVPAAPKCNVTPRRGAILRLAAATDPAGSKTDPAEIADQTRCEFNIPNILVADALTLYTRQAAVQGNRVGYWMTLSARSKSSTTQRGLKGVYGVAEAIQLLLAESGLTASFVQPYEVRVDAEEDTAPPRDDIPLSPVTPTSKKIPEVKVESKRDKAEPIEVSSDGIQPFTTIDGQEIERFGRKLESAIALLIPSIVPHVSGGQPNTVDVGQNPNNLRGLGTNETLFLVNGRRIDVLWTDGARGQGDALGAIPAADVDRVEIYPAPASSRYGGGATGGVVNVILKHDCTNGRLAASYGDSFKTDTPNRSLFLSGCLNPFNDRTKVLFSASQTEESSLQTQSRDLWTRGRASIRQNNSSFYPNSPIPPVGAQTNVRFVGESDSGEIKPGSYLTIPQGYTREQGLGPLLANLGTYNFDLANSSEPYGGGGSVIRNGPHTRYVSANVLQQLFGGLTGHADFTLYEIQVQNPTSIAPYTELTGLYIPKDAKGNVFKQAVSVTVPAVGGDGALESHAHSKQLVVGMDLPQLGSWSGGLEYTHTLRIQGWSLSVGRSAAAAVLSNELDVFRDLSTEGLALGSFADTLFAPELVSRTDAVSLQAEGTVWHWRSGAMKLRGLFEHRSEHFNGGMEYLKTGAADATPTSLLTPQSRDIDSASVEIRAAMGRTTNARSQQAPRFELDLVGRFDEYVTKVAPPRLPASSTAAIEFQSLRFQTFNPALGFQFRPFSPFIVRASFGEGFVPPSGDQLGPPVPRRFQAGAFRDPKRGNELTGAVDFQAGGNPALDPERSRSWSAGLQLEPARERGLQASLTYMELVKVNDIVSPSDLAIMDFALFARWYPERVTRAPAAADDPFGVGPITGIDASHINVARSKIRAWDLDVKYGTEQNPRGQLDFMGRLTWQPEFSNRAAPDAPKENNVAVTANAPLRLGAVGEVSFTRGHGKFSWMTRYFGQYWVSRDSVTIQNQGGRKVGHQTFHDVAYTYDVPQPVSFVNSIQLNASVQNVFDRKPRFDVGSLNYFSPLGDPRGAVYSVGFAARF